MTESVSFRRTVSIPRCAHTMIGYHHNLYVFGGWDGHNMLNHLQGYDIDNNKWFWPSTMGVQPMRRAGHTWTIIQNQLYLCCGNDAIYLNDIHSLDLDTMQWVCLFPTGEPPSPRSRHTSTAVDHLIFIIGGGGDNNIFNDIHIFDTVDLSWHTPTVSSESVVPRWGHTCVSTNDHKLIIFGGNDGSGMLANLQIFDTNDMEWSTPKINSDIHPSARAGHTANYFEYNDKEYMIIFGGGDGVNVFRDCYILDIDLLIWKLVYIEEKYYPRCAHSAVVYDMQLYVLGGGDGYSRFDDLLAVDIEKLFTNQPSEDVRMWLKNFGMEQYLQVFLSNDITVDLLPNLNESHLELMNINSLGARIRIMKEIEKLKEINSEQFIILGESVHHLFEAVKEISLIVETIVDSV